MTIEGRGGHAVASWVLGGDGPPDLASVDTVASVALVARSVGGRLTVSGMSRDMSALLELTGLLVEVQGQSEGREEPLGLEGVQEEAQLGDAIT
jgi:hypothetical protein